MVEQVLHWEQLSVVLPVKEEGAAIGAAIGAAVGGGAGVLIGHKMDKKAAEAAKIEGAQVQEVTDANGLKAVQVTFNSGYSFWFQFFDIEQHSQAIACRFCQNSKK